MPLPTKLPSNIEAEKKVLAAAMTNRVSRVEIVASCTESDFFSPSNRTIFKAICDLDAKGIGADCVSVIDGLRSSGKLAAVGGEAYVIELISDDFAQASYEHYVDILRRDTARRNVIAATAEVTSLTNNPPIDTAEYISAVQDTFLAATEQSVPSDYKSMESAYATSSIPPRRPGRAERQTMSKLDSPSSMSLSVRSSLDSSSSSALGQRSVRVLSQSIWQHRSQALVRRYASSRWR